MKISSIFEFAGTRVWDPCRQLYLSVCVRYVKHKKGIDQTDVEFKIKDYFVIPTTSFFIIVVVVVVKKVGSVFLNRRFVFRYRDVDAHMPGLELLLQKSWIRL